jgi:hypothetical protein
VVPIGDVHVGDRVLSVSSAGQPFYDKVFRITHHEPEETMDFVRIGTSDGNVVEMTATHTVHTGKTSLCPLTPTLSPLTPSPGPGPSQTHPSWASSACPPPKPTGSDL